MTQLFTSHAGPRVFALPPGVNFSKALITGLEERLANQTPDAIARVTVWVNSQRAKRSIEEIYTHEKSTLWPRIRVVTELDTDPLAPLDLPPPVSKLRNKTDLAKLIRALVSAEPGIVAETAAFDLAESLGNLLSELQGEAVDPGLLSRIDTGEHAEHWKQSLRFLGLLEQFARAVGLEGSSGRQRAVADAWAKLWRIEPNQDPIIVAGSTGSRGPTRAFMAAVAQLPQGAIVLPGFDDLLPSSVWSQLQNDDVRNPDHPQYGLANMLGALGVEPGEVSAWTSHVPPDRGRNRLVSLAMRPAPVTDQWLTEGQALASKLDSALEGVTIIDAPDARSEARAIAWQLRLAADLGQKAALVTPDRTLARRVASELDRWRLVPDDSAGRPLALTPPGIFLRLTADLIGAELTAEALLSLLKHPITNSDQAARGEHLRLTAALETDILRGGSPIVDWHSLARWAGEKDTDALAWVNWIQVAVSDIATLHTATLDEFAELHRSSMAIISNGHLAGAAGRIWEKNAGKAAFEVVQSLISETCSFGVTSANEYRSLLISEIALVDVPEEAVVANADIAIWGTLEARIQAPDLLILGGLNEGIWPKQPPLDPWLNRSMRRDLGLPAPEVQIGLSAHDFQQAIAARQVVLSRSKRDSEAPTVPSRWLMRLENLVSGLGGGGSYTFEKARRLGDLILAQAELLDRPEAQIQTARRPSPRPTPDSRPHKLSVTQVETLIRDPYAVYARSVLRLHPLDATGRTPDALLRGNVVHAVLERFVRGTKATWPADPEMAFTKYANEVLEAMVPWSSIRAIWSARLAKSARWFIDSERQRRARSRPEGLEVWGEISVEGLSHALRLTAKADRIDKLSGGGYAIFDYKSGSIPSEREIRAFHLQLPLEAAILENGGFRDLPPGIARHLELIGLGSRVSRTIESAPGSSKTTLERLQKLIGYYQQAANGFTARLRPQRITFDSEYDHLSRRGEWSDSDAPDGSA